jgi:hypothetical protein
MHHLTIEYKRGRKNKATDALSRVPFSDIDENDAGPILESGADGENVDTTTTKTDTETTVDTYANVEDAKTKTVTISKSKDAET